jgi:hypothetical protein
MPALGRGRERGSMCTFLPVVKILYDFQNSSTCVITCLTHFILRGSTVPIQCIGKLKVWKSLCFGKTSKCETNAWVPCFQVWSPPFTELNGIYRPRSGVALTLDLPTVHTSALRDEPVATSPWFHFTPHLPALTSWVQRPSC